MTEKLGDGPIEAAFRETMIGAMTALDEAFNGAAKGPDKKVGMILLVFPYGEAEGRCNYISNGANRRDVLVMLKEQVRRFEGQPEMKGRA